MTRRGTVIRGYAVCASLLLLLPVVPAVAAAASEETPCPGADAWREAHSQELPAALAQRDQARTFSAPDLRTDWSGDSRRTSANDANSWPTAKIAEPGTGCCTWIWRIWLGSRNL